MKSILPLSLRLSLSLIIGLISNFAFAQNESKHVIGLHYGFQIFSQQSQEKAFVRQNTNRYFFPNIFDFDEPRAKMRTFGLSDEINLGSKFFNLVVGINHTSISTLFRDTSKSNEEGVTAFQINKTAESIDFLLVKTVSERTQYIGLPITLKTNLINRKHFQFYLKPTFTAHFKVANDGNVDFYKPQNQQFEHQILDLFESNEKYFSAFQFTTGFRFINTPKFRLSLEADLVYSILSKNISDMVNIKYKSMLDWTHSI